MKIALVQSDWPGMGGGITYMNHLYLGLSSKDNRVGYFVSTLNDPGEWLPSSPFKNIPWAPTLLSINDNYAKESASVLNQYDVIHFIAPGLWMDDKRSESPQYGKFLSYLKPQRAMSVHCTYEETLFPFASALEAKIVFAVREPLVEYFRGKSGYNNIIFAKHPFEPKNKYTIGDFQKMNKIVISPTRINKHKKQHILVPQVDKMNIDRFILYGALRPGHYYCDMISNMISNSRNIHIGGEFNDPEKVFVDALLAIDLTEFKGDGAGTQYTFLEACSYGCIMLMPTEWFSNSIVEYKHGIPISDVNETWEIVNYNIDNRALLNSIRENCLQYVQGHYYDKTIDTFVKGYEGLVPS